MSVSELQAAEGIPLTRILNITSVIADGNETSRGKILIFRESRSLRTVVVKILGVFTVEFFGPIWSIWPVNRGVFQPPTLEFMAHMAHIARKS